VPDPRMFRLQMAGDPTSFLRPSPNEPGFLRAPKASLSVWSERPTVDVTRGGSRRMAHPVLNHSLERRVEVGSTILECSSLS
jgi:hypothetical protein